MDLNIVLAVICGAVALVGAFCVVLQIYHMTVIDATARGLKHPKFWGVFTMSGNTSSNLLMYLIGRRKYPIVNMSESNSKELEKRKKISRDRIVIFGYWCNWYYMCNLNITKKYRFMITFCNIYKAVSLRIDCFFYRRNKKGRNPSPTKVAISTRPLRQYYDTENY